MKEGSKDDSGNELGTETKNTIIVKVNPSVVKMNMSNNNIVEDDEPKVNKVYVVPNKASKESVLKKLNDPSAKIIDASSYRFPSESVEKGSKSKFKKISFAEREIKSENICEELDDEDVCQEKEDTIHISRNLKDEMEMEIREHEISDIFHHPDGEEEEEEEEEEADDSNYLEKSDDDDDDEEDVRDVDMDDDDDDDDDEEEEEEDGDGDGTTGSQRVPQEQPQSKFCNLSWMSVRKTKDLEERIKLAIEAVLKSNMSVKRAAHVYGIRYQLLISKITKAGSSCKGVLGADPALTEKEEQSLVEWIRNRYINGCPVKKIDLVNRVADIVSDGRATRFKDGAPGEKWFMNFMCRNPSVSILGPATRCDSREIPSRQSIISWFNRCEKHLQAFGQDHLLRDPRKVGSVEELTLCLLSSKTKVSKSNGAREGMLYIPEERSGNIMVLLGACADGVMTPPMPVFSCRKPPPSLINSIPSGWGIGLSKDGKINKEVLHSYFKNILIPWLTEDERLPFILFVDNLKNFLSVDTADFCAQKGLLIYNFHPNSSIVLQPLHSSIIEPVKKSWGALSTHKNDKEALLNFCPSLSQVLFDIAPPLVLVESFKICGIYPFDSKAPDYSKCLLIKEGKSKKNFTSNDYAVTLEVFEDIIGQVKTEIFQETLKGFKLLKSEDAPLFKVWRKLLSKVDGTRDSSEPEEYKHEKIIRGANRKLPRPEMYLMVVNEGESHYPSHNFSDLTGVPPKFEEDVENSHSETELEIDINDISKTDREMTTDCKGTTGNSSAFWKDDYRSLGKGPTHKDRKLKLRKMGRKIKRCETNEGIPKDEIAAKRLKKAIGPRYCTQCLEEKGKLIKCMVCKSYIHFECMTDEEQQILSHLYEDKVAFDYICPGCS